LRNMAKNMKKRNYYLTICAIIILLAVIPPARRTLSSVILTFTRPFSTILSSLSFSSRGLLGGLGEISDLKQQNAELAEKLRQSRLDKNECEELGAENEILKKQIGFKDQIKDKELVLAKIISREPTTFLDNIIIDKGQADGILSGMAVVSDGALVGKISEVAGNQAKVTLITSKDSVIQAMLQTNRVMGILRGGLSGITLENIPQDIEVAENEGVITSGLGGGIQQGILIGEVAGQRSSKAEIFKVLNVQPAVDFSKLEIVFVVK